MGSKFKSGLLLSGLLAAGAAVGFALSKSGGTLTKELQADLKILTKNLKKNVDAMQDVTKENFHEVVEQVVEENAKKMKLASAAKKKLVVALQGMWEEVEQEQVIQTAKKAIKKISKKSLT